MKTDQELINEIKTFGDESSLMEIINRHSGIYHVMVDKFLSGQANTQERQSLMEDKEFTIYSSVIKFDPDRGAKFPTYLALETKWKCLNILNKKGKSKECSFEEMIFEPKSSGGFEESEREEVFSLFKEFVEKQSDKRMKKIFDIRYNGYHNKLTPWKTVSKELGMSIQGAINVHNRCLGEFKKKLINYV